MAYYSGADVYALWLAGRNIRSSQESLQATMEAVVDRRRALGTTSHAALVTGQRAGSLEMSGWLSSDTIGYLSGIGTAAVFLGQIAGNTAGALALAGESVLRSGQELSYEDDRAVTYVPRLTLDGQLGLATLACSYATRTTAGNTDSSSVDLGSASSSGRIYLQLGALTLGGYTSLTVTLRHSSDRITFTTHTTLSAMTAIGGQCVTYTSTLYRYVSVGWSWNGSGSGQSASFVVAVGRN